METPAEVTRASAWSPSRAAPAATPGRRARSRGGCGSPPISLHGGGDRERVAVVDLPRRERPPGSTSSSPVERIATRALPDHGDSTPARTRRGARPRTGRRPCRARRIVSPARMSSPLRRTWAPRPDRVARSTIRRRAPPRPRTGTTASAPGGSGAPVRILRRRARRDGSWRVRAGGDVARRAARPSGAAPSPRARRSRPSRSCPRAAGPTARPRRSASTRPDRVEQRETCSAPEHGRVLEDGQPARLRSVGMAPVHEHGAGQARRAAPQPPQIQRARCTAQPARAGRAPLLEG